MPIVSLVDTVSPRPAAISGRFVGYRGAFGSVRTTLVITANTLQGSPFFVPTNTAVDQMAISVTGAAAGGKLLKLLLFDSLANGLPGALISASTDLAADGIAVMTFTIAKTLLGNKLYHAYVWSDGAPTVEATTGIGPYYADSASDVGGGRVSAQQSLTFGTAPDPFGAVGSYALVAPHVAFRVV